MLLPIETSRGDSLLKLFIGRQQSPPWLASIFERNQLPGARPIQPPVPEIPNKSRCCHPERTGPQTLFSLGVVSRRICGCSSANFRDMNTRVEETALRRCRVGVLRSAQCPMPDQARQNRCNQPRRCPIPSENRTPMDHSPFQHERSLSRECVSLSGSTLPPVLRAAETPRRPQCTGPAISQAVR
jgi:hypothetical protein